MISTGASYKGIGAVLSQEKHDGSLRPCSYYAKTLNKAQRKYLVYDQELLAIAVTLNEYRIYIEGCSSIVRSDHGSSTINPYSYTTQYRSKTRSVGIG